MISYVIYDKYDNTLCYNIVYMTIDGVRRDLQRELAAVEDRVELRVLLHVAFKEMFTLLDLCVSSLRRGHANLLCIVPILTDDPRRESGAVGPFGWRHLSHAAFIMRPRLFACVFRRVKDHQNLQYYSPLLKKACVRQVVLDNRFPLK